VLREELVAPQQQLREIDDAFALAKRIVERVVLDEAPREVVARLDLVRAQPRFLRVGDEVLELRCGKRSSSIPCALYIRLISASWSCVSMIWKSCGRFASR
jgi:hypothetical protein